VFEHVIGISLGNPATMRLRRRRPGGFDRFSALLPPRSVYHLSGEARHDWEHSIAPMAGAALVDHLPQPVRQGEAARNGFRRIIRSERRPAAIVSSNATMVTPAKIAATPSLAASALLLSGIVSPSTARK
jgi:hypothetical protein